MLDLFAFMAMLAVKGLDMLLGLSHNTLCHLFSSLLAPQYEIFKNSHNFSELWHNFSVFWSLGGFTLVGPSVRPSVRS